MGSLFIPESFLISDEFLLTLSNKLKCWLPISIMAKTMSSPPHDELSALRVSNTLLQTRLSRVESELAVVKHQRESLVQTVHTLANLLSNQPSRMQLERTPPVPDLITLAEPSEGQVSGETLSKCEESLISLNPEDGLNANSRQPQVKMPPSEAGWLTAPAPLKPSSLVHSAQGTRKQVVVSNLPLNTTPHELLAHVRGGKVVSCELLDTSVSTGAFTGLVRFWDEASARSYAPFCRGRPLVLGGQRAAVTLIDTPTHPLPTHREALIRAGQTRCLRVRHWPRRMRLETICRDIRPCNASRFSSVESIAECDTGELEIRFTSCWFAGMAHYVLTSFRAYRGCEACFVDDPCAGPLAELAQEKSWPELAQEKSRPELAQEKSWPELAQEKSWPELAQEKSRPGRGTLNERPSLSQWIQKRNAGRTTAAVKVGILVSVE